MQKNTVIAQTVVYIDQTYSGTTVCLADYIPCGQSAIIIVIERGVQVVFTAGFTTSATITFKCQPYCQVLFLVESSAQQTDVLAQFAWYLEEKSTVECVIMGTITGEIAMDIDFHVQGIAARASCHALIVVADGAKGAFKTRQLHTAEHTTSTVRVHTLVGTSQFDYRGAIDVDKTSIHAKAIQVNKNILLSAGGKVIAIPTLQVRTNIVNCTHGAAVGGVAAEQLVYLQARGIDEHRARALLLRGFLMDALAGAGQASACFVDQKIATMVDGLLLQ
jgi:Fe-S cluster assembly scaffold protein SufB